MALESGTLSPSLPLPQKRFYYGKTGFKRTFPPPFWQAAFTGRRVFRVAHFCAGDGGAGVSGFYGFCGGVKMRNALTAILR